MEKKSFRYLSDTVYGHIKCQFSYKLLFSWSLCQPHLLQPGQLVASNLIVKKLFGGLAKLLCSPDISLPRSFPKFMKKKKTLNIAPDLSVVFHLPSVCVF